MAVLLKSRANFQKPGPATDRGQTGQHVAPRAALEELRNAAWAAFSLPYECDRARTLGQGLPSGPLSLVPINTPWDSQNRDMQSLG